MADQYFDWYNSVFSPSNTGAIRFGLMNQQDSIGPKATNSPPVINARDIVVNANSLGLGASSNLPRGERDVTLPNGQTIKGSGNAATDFLNGIFGVSPLAGEGDFQTTEGENVAPGAGGILDTSGLGNWFGRVSIIILGFIFVAVGLAMFKTNVIEMVKP